MNKPQYLSGYLEKKGEKGLLRAWQVRWFQQEGTQLFYYEDRHFKGPDDAHGSIDLSSVVSVEEAPPSQKKDKAKMISISTKMGRVYLLREPNDDARKASEWVTRIDDWRKWLKDGGSASPPMQGKEEELARSSSSKEIKPLARGLSGAVERSKQIMKKSVQGVGTLVSTTVAKSKTEDQDGDLDGVKKCGWLVKKGQKRWFALKDGTLLWFKDAQSSASTVTKDNCAGSLLLRDGCQVRRVQDKSSLMVVTPTGKPYELVAFDNGSRDVWLNYLQEACGGVRARAPTIKSPQKLKGWLKKKAGAGKLKPWKKLYAAQQDNELVFFESEDINKPSVASVNLFDISNVDVTYEDGVSPTFEVRTSQGVIYLCALSEEDLEYWTAGLAQFWEQKKGRGGSKAKGPPAVGAEVRVSETLIVKGSVLESNEERKQVLDALENTSDEDEEDEAAKTRTKSGAAGAGAGAGAGEADEDFDSLMDALGSEKSKLIVQRTSEQTGRRADDRDEEDEDSVKEMETASKERMQSSRKPTVIRTETALSEFSASGKLTRKESPAASPVVEAGRSRSKTEIQRRLAQKEQEMKQKKLSEEMAGEELDGLLLDDEDPFADDEKKPLMKQQPAKVSSGAVPKAMIPAKKEPQQPKQEQVKEVAKPAVVVSTDEEDMGDSKKKNAKQLDDDDFDALSVIPSFGFSDEDDFLPAKVVGKKEAKVVEKEEPAVAPAKPTVPPKPEMTKESPPAEKKKMRDVPAPPTKSVVIEKKMDVVVAVVPPKIVKKRVRRAKACGPWVVGDRVMAQFEDDELWYKSYVRKVVKGVVHVEFLGYGNVQACTDETILPIPEDELSEGDEVEVDVVAEVASATKQQEQKKMKEEQAKQTRDADELFNQELDSMLSLPPKPSDDYSSEEFEHITKMAARGSDEEEEDLPVPPPPPEDSDEEEESVLLSKSNNNGTASAAQRKVAVAASQKGPDFDKSGLFEASSRGDVKSVVAILADGKVFCDYQRRKQPQGWSALHFAAQSGQDAVVKRLLERGADPNLQDARERTALHKALGSDGKPSVVKLLLEAKADVFAVNDTGDTVLHEAMSAGCVEALFKSLSAPQRKKLLATQGQDGSSPLHRAATRGRDVCEMFVDTYPDGMELQDANGETPLFAAVRAQQLDVIGLMLESGADIAARNNDDLTVFHVCVREKKDFGLELLMRGALLTEEEVASMLDRQQDEPADLSVIAHGDDDDDDEEQPVFREEVLAKLTAVLKRAFSRRNNNFVLQILSTLRLGEEYLASSDHFVHALLCFNAAAALCNKHKEMAGLSLQLLQEALLWHVPVVVKKARKPSPRLVLQVEDDFAAFQKRHNAFCAKIDPDDQLFPETIANALNNLFENDWNEED